MNTPVKAISKWLSITYSSFLLAVASTYVSFYIDNNLSVLIFIITLFLGLVFFAFIKRDSDYGVTVPGMLFCLIVAISVAAISCGSTLKILFIPSIALGINYIPLIIDIVILLGVPAFWLEFLFGGAKVDSSASQKDIHSRYARFVRCVTCLVVFALILICSLLPVLRGEFSRLLFLMSQFDVPGICETIRGYGIWGIAVSCFLMVLQALAAPIPAYLLTITNAMVYGWVGGSVLSWSSAMIAAAICFWIARLLGRDFILRFVTTGTLAQIDKFFNKFGGNAILILRLLPFMSFDFVSYASGLTGVSFLHFMIATGIGQLPATVLYSYLADNLVGSSYYFVHIIGVVFAVIATIWLIKLVFNRSNKDLLNTQ